MPATISGLIVNIAKDAAELRQNIEDGKAQLDHIDKHARRIKKSIRNKKRKKRR